MKKLLLLLLALLAARMAARALRRETEVVSLLWALVGMTASASLANTPKTRSVEDRLNGVISTIGPQAANAYPKTGGTISGNVTVNGSHTVNGQVNAQTVSASGAATTFGFTSHGNLGVDGTVTVGGDHNVSGQVNSGTLSVSGAATVHGFTSHGGLVADGTLSAANFSGTFSGSHSGSYAGGQNRPGGYPIPHGTPWEDQVIDVINNTISVIIGAHVSN
ncbi:MAG TPA: hypothetical protein VGH54_29400 [Mycobacterium sp.]|jgi:hypothetical protein|uniref:hypothetical protein n=1 Tax=Mycobacterium sp. TaxID=1785 RepID=UPI002F3E2680